MSFVELSLACCLEEGGAGNNVFVACEEALLGADTDGDDGGRQCTVSGQHQNQLRGLVMLTFRPEDWPVTWWTETSQSLLSASRV